MDDVLKENKLLCVLFCASCQIRFLEKVCNKGRKNIRCTFGCRQLHLRRTAKARNDKYLNSLKGIKSKQRQGKTRRDKKKRQTPTPKPVQPSFAPDPIPKPAQPNSEPAPKPKPAQPDVEHDPITEPTPTDVEHTPIPKPAQPDVEHAPGTTPAPTTVEPAPGTAPAPTTVEPVPGTAPTPPGVEGAPIPGPTPVEQTRPLEPIKTIKKMCAMLEWYLCIILGLIEGRKVARDDLRIMLAEIDVRRGLGKLSPRDYIAQKLNEKPP